MSRVSRLLNTSAEVWRQTRTPDGMGGWDVTWAQLSTVRARLSQPSAMERQIAAQAQAQLTHVVYAEDTADIRRNDQLRRDGLIYEVTDTYQPSVPGTYLRVNCTLQQPQ